MKIYLDVCCLNRPFDDAADPRVALEATAILHVLQLIEAESVVDYSSEMARIEIDRIPDPDRRRKTLVLLPPSDRIVSLDDDLLDVADAIVSLGFSLADAVHLAAAKKIGVDVLLTVDDKLLKRSKRFAKRLDVRVTDPISFLEEREDDR